VSDAPMIVWLDGGGDTSSRVLGGKFSSLAEMTQAGFAVPGGFGITTAAYEAFLEHNALHEELRAALAGLDRSDLVAVEALSERLAARIADAPLPPALESAIADAYAQLAERMGDAELPVAVRSSGVSEDLAGASFAGQYDTYLWIVGAAAVVEHVKRCWTGLFGPQVLTYQPTDGMAAGTTGMCVGVQAMVPARAAGVMFTLDPVSGDRSKIVIEACWGLGEGVVSGDVTPDRFRVDKVTLELLASELAVKESMHAFDPATGAVTLRAVPEDRREQACLAEENVSELATLAKRIERHRGAPQDIEWAVDDDDRVHVLQVRPETVWSQRPARTVTGATGGRAVDRVLAKFMMGLPKGGDGA
jgi:pyruvate,water dikinase